MVIVGTDESLVHSGLKSGEIQCPDCNGQLRPWGYARPRIVRFKDHNESKKPHRGICKTCKKTHVLLADDSLVRHADSVSVVGEALSLAAGGENHISIAEKLNRPIETVRGWILSVRRKAKDIRDHFTIWAMTLDPTTEIEPAGSVFKDAISAIGLAGKAAVLRGLSSSPWKFGVFLTAGLLLSKNNTKSHWISPFSPT